VRRTLHITICVQSAITGAGTPGQDGNVLWAVACPQVSVTSDNDLVARTVLSCFTLSAHRRL